MYRIITSASKLVKAMEYDTTFGTFRIETSESKRRGKDRLGRTQPGFQTYTYTTGFFKDHQDWISFFLQQDGEDKYVSSSEGSNSAEFIDEIGEGSYSTALEKFEAEVVPCFQDYFNDKSIY